MYSTYTIITYRKRLMVKTDYLTNQFIRIFCLMNIKTILECKFTNNAFRKCVEYTFYSCYRPISCEMLFFPSLNLFILAIVHYKFFIKS
jgi:hypothetical protein